MSIFKFDCFNEFFFDNIATWHTESQWSTKHQEYRETFYLSLCNHDGLLVAHLAIPKGVEDVTVTVDIPPFQGEFRVERRGVISALEQVKVEDDADPALVKEYFEFVDKLRPELNFVGAVWVNPICGYWRDGRFFQSEICQGERFDSFEDFLVAFESGILWGDPEFEGDVLDLFGDPKQPSWIGPGGALVAPCHDNPAVQPVTDRQVVVSARGEWNVRENEGSSDPSYQGVVERLKDVPLRTV